MFIGHNTKMAIVTLTMLRSSPSSSLSDNIDGGSGFDTYFDALKWVIFDWSKNAFSRRVLCLFCVAFWGYILMCQNVSKPLPPSIGTSLRTSDLGTSESGGRSLIKNYLRISDTLYLRIISYSTSYNPPWWRRIVPVYVEWGALC